MGGGGLPRQVAAAAAKTTSEKHQEGVEWVNREREREAAGPGSLQSIVVAAVWHIVASLSLSLSVLPCGALEGPKVGVRMRIGKRRAKLSG